MGFETRKLWYETKDCQIFYMLHHIIFFSREKEINCMNKMRKSLLIMEITREIVLSSVTFRETKLQGFATTICFDIQMHT